MHILLFLLIKKLILLLIMASGNKFNLSLKGIN